MPIKLIQYPFAEGGANGIVTAENDASLYYHILKANTYIKQVKAELLGGNQMQVFAGSGTVYGRGFEVTDEVLTAPLTVTGTMRGRLTIKIDIGNPDIPIAFNFTNAATLPHLVQQNFFEGGTIFEVPVAEYDVSQTQISNITIVPFASDSIVRATTKHLDLFVSPAGSDTTGDGSQSKPFKTIKYTLSTVPKYLVHNVNINLAQGTYPEEVIIAGVSGNGNLSILGGETTALSAQFIVNAVTVHYAPHITIRGIRSLAKEAFTIIGAGRTEVFFCSSINAYAAEDIATGLVATEGAIVAAQACLFANKHAAIISQWQSNVFCNNISGTGNNYGLVARHGGALSEHDTNPVVATVKYVAHNGGLLVKQSGVILGS